MNKKYKLSHTIKCFDLKDFNDILGDAISKFQKEGYQVEIHFSSIFLPKNGNAEEAIVYTALLLMY